MARKIRRDDNIIVIAGNSKGSRGRVKSIEGDWAVVDGVNKRIRCSTKKNKGMYAFFAPIHVSNLAHCIDSKPVRVGFKFLDGKKWLINKKTSERIRSVW